MLRHKRLGSRYRSGRGSSRSSSAAPTAKTLMSRTVLLTATAVGTFTRKGGILENTRTLTFSKHIEWGSSRSSRLDPMSERLHRLRRSHEQHAGEQSQFGEL